MINGVDVLVELQFFNVIETRNSMYRHQRDNYIYIYIVKFYGFGFFDVWGQPKEPMPSRVGYK